MARIRALVAVAALVFLASCGADPTINDTSSTAAATEHVLTGTFAAIDGTEIDLAELQGQDVVLWFWAPW